MLATLFTALMGSCGGLLWWLRRDPLGAYRTFYHEDIVNAIAFDDTGGLVATGGEDGLRIWNVREGRQVDFYTWRVAALEWVKDKLVIAAPDEGVIVLNTATSRVEHTFGKSAAQMPLAVSADGKYIASSFSPLFFDPPKDLTKRAFAIHIWDTATGESALLIGHEGPVGTIAFDPQDNSKIISGSKDTTVRVWNRVTRAQVAIVGKPKLLSEQMTSDVSRGALDVSCDGQTLLRGRNVCPLLKPDCRQQLDDSDMLATHAGQFSLDGRLIATGHADGTVRLWSFPQLQLLATFPANRNGAPIYAVDFSPDGKLLAAGGMGQIGTFDAWGEGIPMYDRAVRVWKVADLRGQ